MPTTLHLFRDTVQGSLDRRDTIGATRNCKLTAEEQTIIRDSNARENFRGYARDYEMIYKAGVEAGNGTVEEREKARVFIDDIDEI